MDKISFAFLILVSLVPNIPRVVHGHRTLSCDQTPYPQICNSIIKSSMLQASSEEADFTFRDMALAITLEQAQEAHRVISSMSFTSVIDERAKVAWEDCIELYEDTVYQLNQTILGPNYNPYYTYSTIEDVQTFLSASIANLETCKHGFIDFNLSSHLDSFPSSLTDFSKLLANTLAINRLSRTLPATQFTGKHTDTSNGGRRLLLANGFPSWVSLADRKLLQSSSTPTRMKSDIVVAKDGSGNYKTISEAIDASSALRSGTRRFVIYVKAGIYNENVVVLNKMKNLMLIGDGIDATVVTSNKNVMDGYTTFRSATFGIGGDGFIAKGITFENTAGPEKQQAVALRSGSDFSVFYQCSFKGYQDTLYVYSKRQFYRECDIYGTVDFIFGDSSAVLQSCNIYVRRPMNRQDNTVTAQGRSDQNENTGIVIHDCVIQAAPDLAPVQGSFQTFLGRPWKAYSRTVVMKSVIGGLVDPAGWAPWSGDFALSTLYYGEYMNIGSGAGIGGRVNWPGYHVIRSPVEVRNFTVGNFLAGDAWIPATGVPYASGL